MFDFLFNFLKPKVKEVKYVEYLCPKCNSVMKIGYLGTYMDTLSYYVCVNKLYQHFGFVRILL